MHPILFSFGPFTLRSYGVLMAVSFLLGIWLALRLNRRAGRPDEVMLDLSTAIMLGAVVGARALYVVVMWPDYAQAPLDILKVWEGGLVYYGGLIGAGLASYFWLRSKGHPIWAYGDVVAPGLALGQVTGRLGCWFNGCCYGREDHAHGVIFPALMDGVPHLPVMLYEAAFCLALAGALYLFWPRRKFDGQVFWLYVLAYALFRFGIEFLRGDAERGSLFSDALSPSQWISVLGAGLALLFLLQLSRRSAQKAA
jgi:phosphatidylglycerol:prolipoprotein diacylglycerol transferase